MCRRCATSSRLPCISNWRDWARGRTSISSGGKDGWKLLWSIFIGFITLIHPFLSFFLSLVPQTPLSGGIMQHGMRTSWACHHLPGELMKCQLTCVTWQCLIIMWWLDLCEFVVSSHVVCSKYVYTLYMWLYMLYSVYIYHLYIYIFGGVRETIMNRKLTSHSVIRQAIDMLLL